MEVLFSEKDIRDRTAEIAREIDRDFARSGVVVIGVLKGAFIFISDLVRLITVPVTVDFVQLSSYGTGKSSSGSIAFKKDIDVDIAGRNVLVVEDIIDTGFTMEFLIGELQKRGPADIKVCTLLDKASRRIKNIDIAYTGFQAPDKFVVGYGLDHDEKYRNLPYIAGLK